MANRLDLHEMLCGILESRNAYFQPPNSKALTYPAIVYSLSNIKNNNASDSVYIQSRGYTITVIDKNPDCIFSDKMSKIVNCKFDRAYVVDNLYHYIYTLYY